MYRKNTHSRYGSLLLIALLALCMLALSIFLLNKSMQHSTTDTHVNKTVWHNGVAYYPRQDISLFLIMGVDRSGPVVDSGSYNNSGAADAVMLVIFDETAEKFDVLALNRDTMVDMPVLGLQGRPVGTVNAQLALSHTYGNGLEASSENTRDTVSKLLCGIDIEYYLTMNMDVVSILNDAVGGVRVHVTDDFSGVDSSIGMGEVVLNGSQALNFIRTRKDVADSLNISRMTRQRAYMNGFVEAYQKTNNDDFFDALNTFEEIEPYIVTNCSEKVLLSLLERFEGFRFDEVITPKGENVKGEVYMEFHVDQNALLDLTLELLYEPK